MVVPQSMRSMMPGGARVPGFVSPWRSALDSSKRELENDNLLVDDDGTAYDARTVIGGPGAVAQNLIQKRDREYEQRKFDDARATGKMPPMGNYAPHFGAVAEGYRALKDNATLAQGKNVGVARPAFVGPAPEVKPVATTAARPLSLRGFDSVTDDIPENMRHALLLQGFDRGRTENALEDERLSQVKQGGERAMVADMRKNDPQIQRYEAEQGREQEVLDADTARGIGVQNANAARTSKINDANAMARFEESDPFREKMREREERMSTDKASMAALARLFGSMNRDDVAGYLKESGVDAPMRGGGDVAAQDENGGAVESIGQVPAADRAQIEQALREKRYTVNDANILRVYNANAR